MSQKSKSEQIIIDLILYRHTFTSTACRVSDGFAYFLDRATGKSGIPSVTEVIQKQIFIDFSKRSACAWKTCFTKYTSNQLTCSCALWSLSPLKPVPVEPHIPIRKLLDETHQPRNHGVQAVCLHLCVDKLRGKATNILLSKPCNFFKHVAFIILRNKDKSKITTILLIHPDEKCYLH